MIDIPHNYSGVGSGPGVNKLYTIFKRISDGYIFNTIESIWEAPLEANSGDYATILTEYSTTKNYYFDVPDELELDNSVMVMVYTQYGNNPSLNADRFECSNLIQSSSNIWDYTISGVLSAIKVFRLIESGLFGITRSFSGSPGNREFFNLARTKRRFVANIDVNGNRLTITHDDLS